MLQKILLCILLGTGGIIYGQKVVLDINGRVNIMQPDEYSSSDTFSYLRLDRIDDTTVIRIYTTSVSTRTQDYIASLGYELNGLFSIRVAERLGVRTGIGIQFGSFSVGSESDFLGSVETGRDTVFSIVSPGGGGGSSICDCFSNSYFDVIQEQDRRIHFENINLSIPVEATYQIIPDKLSLSAGGYFHTPLYAASKRTYANIEMTTDGDMTKCEWVRVDEKNTAATGISNFQWGVSAWLGYFILPNLQLELGVRKQMSDVFMIESQQFFLFDNNSYKPLTISAGVSYRFNLSAPPPLQN